jgi:hypothetical protein
MDVYNRGLVETRLRKCEIDRERELLADILRVDEIERMKKNEAESE